MWEVYILPLGVKRGVNVLNMTISLTSFIFMTTPWFYTMMSFFNLNMMKQSSIIKKLLNIWIICHAKTMAV